MSCDLTLLNILYVTNFANYMNTKLGTRIIVSPDGVIDEENSSFITREGTEITTDQISELLLSYGKNMEKMLGICSEAALDGAISGVTECLSGTDPNITLTITSR